jgi:hypothetical protein
MSELTRNVPLECRPLPGAGRAGDLDTSFAEIARIEIYLRGNWLAAVSRTGLTL